LRAARVVVAVLVLLLVLSPMAVAAPDAPLLVNPTLSTPGAITFAEQGTGLLLTWRFESKPSTLLSLVGFHVYRSTLWGGSFPLTEKPVVDQVKSATGPVWAFVDPEPLAGLDYVIHAVYSDGSTEVAATGRYTTISPTTTPGGGAVADVHEFHLSAAISGHRVDLSWDPPVDTSVTPAPLYNPLEYLVCRRSVTESGAGLWVPLGLILDRHFIDYADTGSYEYYISARIRGGQYIDSAVCAAAVASAPGPQRYLAISSDTQAWGLLGTVQAYPNVGIIEDFQVIWDQITGTHKVVFTKPVVDRLTRVLGIPLEIKVRVMELRGDKYIQTQQIILTEAAVAQKRLVFSEAYGMEEEFTLTPRAIRWEPMIRSEEYLEY
jgi:hypothetical protein